MIDEGRVEPREVCPTKEKSAGHGKFPLGIQADIGNIKGMVRFTMRLVDSEFTEPEELEVCRL
jgi:hypothetical protein